jgi:hypothetical protein
VITHDPTIQVVKILSTASLRQLWRLFFLPHHAQTASAFSAATCPERGRDVPSLYNNDKADILFGMPPGFSEMMKHAPYY